MPQHNSELMDPFLIIGAIRARLSIVSIDVDDTLYG